MGCFLGAGIFGPLAEMAGRADETWRPCVAGSMGLSALRREHRVYGMHCRTDSRYAE